MKRYGKALVVLGLVLVMALAGTLVVSAQGPGKGGLLGGFRWGTRGGSSSGLDAIAKLLNMTTDELKTQLRGGATLADLADKAGVQLQALRDASNAATQAAMRESIEKAVTDGKLTREQADWMLQGLDKGFTGRGAMGKGAQDQPELEAAAKVLNMTVDQLSLQLWGGRTWAQLAEKAGVKLEDVQKAMEAARIEAMKQAIEQAVKDGKITRERADWMLKGLESGYMSGGHGMNGLGGFGGGRGMRGLEMPGGMRGGGMQRGVPKSGTPQQTPTPKTQGTSA